jgi:alpha-mannosidase
VRVEFPLSVSNPKATYDLQTGVIERGNGHQKQFEYGFQQWFDLTDAKREYGVTVMSDSKYGADKPSDNTVRLTVLHTPGTRGGYPDQGSQDLVVTTCSTRSAATPRTGRPVSRRNRRCD